MWKLISNPYFISIYVIVGLLQVWIPIYCSRRFGKSEELNAKYYSFARVDYKHWGYLICGLLNLVTLWPIRFGLNCILVCFLTLWTLLCMIGH